MSKGKAVVSSDFAKFYGRHQVAIDEAKKAENSMSSGPAPVGWEGQCVILEAAAEVGKDKKDDKGNITPGNPRVRIKFGIVGDPQYQGKHFTKFWIFNDTANASAIDRFEWFLNACEMMGLPRQVRENHESLEEILNWFIEGEHVFSVKCESDNYAQDKKKMTVAKLTEAVDTTSSMVPTDSSTPAPTTPTTSSPEITEGSHVMFLNHKWEVVAIEGDRASIKRDDNGTPRTREVALSAVTPC